jgi:hypothetical protein
MARKRQMLTILKIKAMIVALTNIILTYGDKNRLSKSGIPRSKKRRF